jgi:RND family efflux transporter MFP subunit
MHCVTFRTCILGSALISVLAVAGIGCKQQGATAPTATPVRTSIVQAISRQNGATYSASIVPYAQVELAFQSGGYVEKIYQVKNPSGGMRNVDQGDWIVKGTVLAVVRQQDYKDKLQQAQAQLGRAQAEQEKAKLSFDRVAALYSTQSATKPDYDSAKAQLDSTTASVSGSQAQINEAKVALDDASLRAPFSGWLVARNVDLGSLVGPATKGFTIADTRSVKAVFGVPDILMNQVHLGQHFVVSTDALSHPVAGRVSAISPAADAKSRVFSVEVTLPNPKNEVKSGMIASLVLGGQKMSESILAVPVVAIVRDPERTDSFAVMTVQGDDEVKTAQRRPVELGDMYGNMIAVKSGLTPGERVITTGATLVKTGDKVRIVP